MNLGMRCVGVFWVAVVIDCCPALAVASGRTVDLTHAFGEETIYWPTAEPFRLQVVSDGITSGGYYYAANNFSAAEHGGTHVDAPVHFAQGRRSVDEIPLEQLMGEAIVVDVSAPCAANRDYQIGVADFERWEAQHGRVKDGLIVLLYTGFGKYWPDVTRYLGTARRGPEGVKELHFPGLAPDAARWLVENRHIKAVGLDTASIDFGQSTTYGSHRALFEKNVPAFENLANLDQLPATGLRVIALPMKIKKGSGAPLRIIATY